MKHLFQENRNAFLLLLGLLFILIITVYFLFYKPLAVELEQSENQETSLRDEIAILEMKEKNISSSNGNEIKEIERMKLERVLPSTPELETFLLTLNEIELISNSLVSDMSFGYQGELPVREEISEEEMQEAADGEAKEDTETEDGESENSVEEGSPVIDMAEVPEGLQPISVTLEIQSPDYEHFQLFLKEIEKQERLMFVTNLEFTKPAENELVLVEESDETISATIDVTTFYYEE